MDFTTVAGFVLIGLFLLWLIPRIIFLIVDYKLKRSAQDKTLLVSKDEDTSL